MKRMQKILRIIAAMLLCIATLPSAATYKEGYYDKMDGKRKESLKAAAKECVSAHTRLTYQNLPNQWQYTDVYPELVNGLKRWWDMYSNQVYLIETGESGVKSFQRNKMQREHSVPKSWWKLNGDVEYTPAYSDIWNLYPSDAAANQAKLNYPLGIVSGGSSFDNGVTKVGNARTGTGGGSGKVFEPGDEYKGDFARAFFYMATVYDDINWVINYMYAKETYPTLKSWAVDMLLQWARQDPVSQKEILRNDMAERYQRNRNPFVDFPELAEYIWGTRMAETFYIKDQGGTVTPPITGDPELTRPVNGEALDFGQAAVGSVVTSYLDIVGKNFTQPLSVSISGAAKGMFKAETTTINASTINTTSVYRLPITFTPTAEGRQEAKLMLYDGGLEGSVAVTLIGEGCAMPQLDRPLALPATNITNSNYVANWQELSQPVDFYVVSRVRYMEDGLETDTYESDTNSLLIENRNPAVAESYTVQASRLGFLSESSNSILVAASGVESVNANTPVVIGVIPGGFNVISNPDGADIEVYDASGLKAVHVAAPTAGEEVMLPGGVYLLTSPAMSRPLKIIVMN